VKRIGTPSSAGDAKRFAVVVSSQKSDGRTVVLDAVTIEGGHKGYAVVYADGNGAPGKLLGASSLLPAGESKLVKVTLKTPLTVGSVPLHVVVHVEGNNDADFDYPGSDIPAQVGPGVVTVRFSAEVGKSG